MGQQRSDTAIQRGAKQQVADSRKCPACNRRSILSTRYELRDDWGRRIGSARTCKFCGHEVGIRHGEPFGTSSRLATPESEKP